jgi:Tfp pilus assembly protein PilN
MKKSYKIIIQLTIASFFTVLSVLAFLYIFNSLQIKNKNFVNFLKETEELEQKREKIKTLNNSVEEVFLQKEELDKYFAKKSDVVPFLDTLQSLSVQAGAPAEFSYLDLSTDGKGLEVQIKSEGTFSAIYKFLSILENSPYLFEFTDMNLQRKESLNEEGELIKIQNPLWILSLRMTLVSFIDR